MSHRGRAPRTLDGLEFSVPVECRAPLQHRPSESGALVYEFCLLCDFKQILPVEKKNSLGKAR